VRDERAEFEALFHQTRGPLLGYLTRRAPAEDAADLLADVYLVAWRRRADLPPGEERRLWLFGVARRLVADHHRSAGARAGAEGAVVPVEPRAGEDDPRGDAVRAALETLSELDRELVTLTTWEGLSPAEAGRVVGVTAGTARVRLHRARARLARHPRLSELLDADDVDAVADAPARAG
jgi:RNA polymerase sigma-70 factor (ECF subfamily)